MAIYFLLQLRTTCSFWNKNQTALPTFLPFFGLHNRQLPTLRSMGKCIAKEPFHSTRSVRVSMSNVVRIVQHRNIRKIPKSRSLRWLSTLVPQAKKKRNQSLNKMQLTAAKAIPTYCFMVNGLLNKSDHHTARNKLDKTCARGN